MTVDPRQGAPPKLLHLAFLPTRRWPAYWWLVVFIALQMVDFVTGPYYQLPSTYVLPVIAAAWFSGLLPGVAMALALPLGRVYFMFEVWHEPWDSAAFLATAVTRMMVFTVVAVAADRLANHERLLAREITQLVSLLPVCEGCRRIRDHHGEWSSLDALVASKTSDLQPGLCTDCARARFPEHFQPADSPGRRDTPGS